MLSTRDLNRTLLLRQHLLERSPMPPLGMVEHLIGLQAQENLPPYLSLAARVRDSDPASVSAAIEERDAVRLLSMRGTIHLLVPDDALSLRRWVQPALDQQSAGNQASRPARHVPVDEVVAAVRRLLEDGPLPVKQLGERLAELFPTAPAGALAHVARERVPLVQLPPRGLWHRSGGVVYQTVENHLGRPTFLPDVRELVRRYLRAFGPAAPSDMTVWSRVTRLGPVFAAMRDELLVVECEDGRTRYDLPDAPRAGGDRPAPVRLLGTYDNVFLSHADRSRIVSDEGRARWMGPNGGVGNVILLDGFMAGIWRVSDGRVETELVHRPSRQQKAELDGEVAAVERLLAQP